MTLEDNDIGFLSVFNPGISCEQPSPFTFELETFFHSALKIPATGVFLEHAKSFGGAGGIDLSFEFFNLLVCLITETSRSYHDFGFYLRLDSQWTFLSIENLQDFLIFFHHLVSS
jgi:hypothetical protein